MSGGVRIEPPTVDTIGRDLSRTLKDIGEGAKTLGQRQLDYLGDVAYSVGSGNYNSMYGSLVGGEGSRKRAAREQKEKLDTAAAADAQAKVNEADRKVRTRIDAFGTAQRKSPGSSILLNAANTSAKNLLITPSGRGY